MPLGEKLMIGMPMTFLGGVEGVTDMPNFVHSHQTVVTSCHCYGGLHTK